MYGIDIFENINMSMDWHMIYWGIKNKILSADIVKDYICGKMEQDNLVTEEELELLWVGDLNEVLKIIEEMPQFYTKKEENLMEAKNKIRIALIISLRNTEKNISELIEKIDMIYADFDYPQDMEKFISYMPMDDEYIPEEHSLQDNRCYLIDKLDSFIDEQVKKYNLQRTTSLPWKD